MSAPVEQVEQVKQAAAGAIMSLPDATLYSITRETFYRVYGRQYAPATDRREFERIKHHVRRALSGDNGPGRGGKRDGAGREKVTE